MIGQRAQRWAVWILCLVLGPERYLSLSVRFPSDEPLYVVLGQTLVLEARLDLADGERVTVATWEREAEGRTEGGRVKVAEFPGKAPDPRIASDQQGATLRLAGFRHEDRGIYTLTVTGEDGTRTSAATTVREYEAVHHVSVAVNASHWLLWCGEAWGTEPRYSWLYEGRPVREEVGRPSPDGSHLLLSARPCGHFTCIVSNRLGHSSATYSAEPCERPGGGATVGMAFLVVLAICGGVLAFLAWRRRRKWRQGGVERLREPCEDQL